MQFISFFAIIAVSAAGQLPSRNYLPQSRGAQGSFQQSQSFQSSQGLGFVPLGGSSDNGNRRPQQEREKNAQVLKLDQEANAESGDYHYSYETSNGIRAEEAGNSVQSSGGFAYKGDDGNTYTITYTAGEGGFRPEGAHLPVPPPTPQEILLALERNAKDEAAGIFDDGQYRPDANSKGGAFRNKASGSFSASSSSSAFQSSSSSQFGSANRQGTFNANSGYTY